MLMIILKYQNQRFHTYAQDGRCLVTGAKMVQI